MLKLIVYKDKITATKWDETNKTWPEYDISKTDGAITKYFNRLVEVKPDVTVEDFMLHLEKHEPVIDYCFSDYMKGNQFRVFLDDMNKDNIETDLGEIELCWEGEIVNENFAVIGYLRGWLKDEKIKELGEEHEVPNDVSFLPIHLWKKCTFILNENIIVNNIVNLANLEKEIVFAGLSHWTLFEVISHFLEELSVNGSPEERDKMNSLMESKKYDVKEIIKYPDQVDFWLAFMEAELDDLNSALEFALENEEYENASKLKVDIEIAEKDLFELREEVKKSNGEV
jgi:hypothetical protein